MKSKTSHNFTYHLENFLKKTMICNWDLTMGTSYIEKSDSSNHMECISNNAHFYRLEWSTNPGVFPINKTCGIHCYISLISPTKKKKRKKKKRKKLGLQKMHFLFQSRRFVCNYKQKKLRKHLKCKYFAIVNQKLMYK